jgi:hypothetical protein
MAKEILSVSGDAWRRVVAACSGGVRWRVGGVRDSSIEGLGGLMKKTAEQFRRHEIATMFLGLCGFVFFF